MSEPSTPQSDSSPEQLLNGWMLFARRNIAFHEAAKAHFSTWSDTGLITACVMGSAGGLINILLCSTSGTGVVVNGSQIAMGIISVVSAAIMSISKQLGWESRAHTHDEYAGHYSAPLISFERALARLNASSYASGGDLIKKDSAELDRIEDNAPSIPSFIEKKMEHHERNVSTV
jgi:hypothetical protein